MEVDSELKNMKTDKPEGGSAMQMDSEHSSEITNSEGKEKEDLTKSMGKLHMESSSSGLANFKKKPVIIIVVGMAGSGKTTFMHRLVCHTYASNIRGYVMNLDPAVLTLPFAANIDIRDTVRYKEVMKQFNLGPNGGIMTSLNLFATKFDEVISVIEKRADQLDYVLVDTPGQIEIFTWSASGAIITEWMEDFEVFNAALDSDQSYTSTLTRSLSLALDDFYKNLRSVGVSAVSGAGMNDFFKAVEASSEEYMENYKADLDKRRAEKQRLEEERRRENMEKLRKDMEKSGGETVVLSTGLKDKKANGKKMDEDDEEGDDDEEEDDDGVVAEDDYYGRFSQEEDDDFIDEDEDEEVGRFSL